MADLYSEIRQSAELAKSEALKNAQVEHDRAVRLSEARLLEEAGKGLLLEEIARGASEAVEVFRNLGLVAVPYIDHVNPPHFPQKAKRKLLRNPVKLIITEYQAGLRGESDEKTNKDPIYPMGWALTEKEHTKTAWGYEGNPTARESETARRVAYNITTHYSGLLLTTEAEIFTYEKTGLFDLPVVQRPEIASTQFISPSTMHTLYISYATRMLTTN